LQPLFDTSLAIARKRRAMANPRDGAGFLMERVADDLAERFAVVERRFPEAAVLFSVTADGASVLRASGKVDHVVRVEADPSFSGTDDSLVASPETVPLAPESLDLAVSLLALHEVNDVPGLMIQIRRALRADGLFLAALPGAGTLSELRDSLISAEGELRGGAAARVYPFADVRDMGGLLQRAGFALPVADVETITVRYSTMFGLLRDLRAMGATSALLDRPRRPLTRGILGRAAEIYAERYADADGRIRATFSIVWLSGWVPHPTQRQPLKPGSAQMSLAKALAEKG
jgi:SAM-dependent methyltransferase